MLEIKRVTDKGTILANCNPPCDPNYSPCPPMVRVEKQMNIGPCHPDIECQPACSPVIKGD